MSPFAQIARHAFSVPLMVSIDQCEMFEETKNRARQSLGAERPSSLLGQLAVNSAAQMPWRRSQLPATPVTLLISDSSARIKGSSGEAQSGTFAPPTVKSESTWFLVGWPLLG